MPQRQYRPEEPRPEHVSSAIWSPDTLSALANILTRNQQSREGQQAQDLMAVPELAGMIMGITPQAARTLASVKRKLPGFIEKVSKKLPAQHDVKFYHEDEMSFTRHDPKTGKRYHFVPEDTEILGLSRPRVPGTNWVKPDTSKPPTVNDEETVVARLLDRLWRPKNVGGGEWGPESALMDEMHYPQHLNPDTPKVHPAWYRLLEFAKPWDQARLNRTSGSPLVDRGDDSKYVPSLSLALASKMLTKAQMKKPRFRPPGTD